LENYLEINFVDCIQSIIIIIIKKKKDKICVKMYGTGPSVIEEEMCGKFYRYNSGRKEFCLLGGSKSIERTTCAVSLYPGCYNKGYGKSSGGMPDFMK
jgi:hypothetical protein